MQIAYKYSQIDGVLLIASVSADIIAAKVLAGGSAEIVKHRNNLGMTQKQFTEYMEVSQGMVSKRERGCLAKKKLQCRGNGTCHLAGPFVIEDWFR